MGRSLEDILDRNRVWAAERLDADPEYFSRQASGQQPAFLWIGCADSRVPPNVIAGLDPGEVFVHRNIANVVRAADMNCMAVLEYAIEHLRIKHIIVCGHYGCGGVRAVTQPREDGLVDDWLEAVRDVAFAASDELSATNSAKAREDRLCELNVRAQVRNVSKSPIVQRAWARGEPIEIHGWIYGLEDGLLRDLHCTRAAGQTA